MEDPNQVDLQTRILDAATSLFATRGYAGTSIREVCEAVGCTKPALYYWFGSKQDLFVACVHGPLDIFRDLLRDISERRGSTRERFGLLAEAIRAGVEEHPEAMRIVMTARLRPEPGQPLVDLRTVHAEYLGCLVGVLQDGVRRGEVRADVPVLTIALAFLGVLHTRILTSLDPDADASLPPWCTDDLLDLFLSGARAEETAP